MKFSFEQLVVYQESRKLVKTVYLFTKKFPSYEKYSLCSQLQRAAVSVSSNIAESTGRRSMKEKLHFIEMAYGSLMEVFCQLQLASDLGYLTEDDVENQRERVDNIARLLRALSYSYSRLVD